MVKPALPSGLRPLSIDDFGIGGKPFVAIDVLSIYVMFKTLHHSQSKEPADHQGRNI